MRNRKRRERQIGKEFDYCEFIVEEKIREVSERQAEHRVDEAKDAREKSEKHSEWDKWKDENICRECDHREIAHGIQDKRQDKYVCRHSDGNDITESELFRDPVKILFHPRRQVDHRECRDK